MTNPLFIAEELIRNEYHIEYTEDGAYVYLASDQQAELQIASNVKRLLQPVTAYPNPRLSISELETLSNYQEWIDVFKEKL